MSLQEYLSNAGSTKSSIGEVELIPSEFQYWTAYYNKKWEFSIHVYAFPTSTYLLDDEGVLCTTDNQGNYKSRSVFFINREKYLDV